MGLIYSDGSIGINISKRNEVTLTFTLDQSFEKPFLDYICSYLKVGRVERKSVNQSLFNSSNDAWRFKVDCLQDCIKKNNYFSQFLFFTPKTSTRYSHWSQVLKWK